MCSEERLKFDIAEICTVTCTLVVSFHFSETYRVISFIALPACNLGESLHGFSPFKKKT